MNVLKRHWKWFASTALLAVVAATTIGSMSAVASSASAEEAMSDVELLVVALEAENAALGERLAAIEQSVASDDGSLGRLATVESDMDVLVEALQLAANGIGELEVSIATNKAMIEGAYTLADTASSANVEAYNQIVGELNSALDEYGTFLDDVRSCINWNLNQIENRFSSSQYSITPRYYLRDC